MFMPKKSLKNSNKSTRGQLPTREDRSTRPVQTPKRGHKPLKRKTAGTSARQRKKYTDFTGSTADSARFEDFGDLNEQARSAPRSIETAFSTREVRNFGGAANVALRIMDEIAPVPDGSVVARARDVRYYLGLIESNPEARRLITEIFSLIERKKALALQIIDNSTAPSTVIEKEFVQCSVRIVQLLREFQLLNTDTKSLVYKVAEAIAEIAREAGNNVGH